MQDMEFNGYNMIEFNMIVNKLNKQIMQNLSQDLPVINGEWEFDYFERNKNLKVNEEGEEENNLISYFADLFNGVVRWSHPFAFHNVKTPINIIAGAVAAVTMLYDPNLAEDQNCGSMANAELEVVNYMAEIIGWEKDKVSGYFTFGGTGTLLAAVKAGVGKSKVDVCQNGIGEGTFIICSKLEHHSIRKVCNWLGIGIANCVQIKTNNCYEIDLNEMEKSIDERIGKGDKLAAIVLCGGTTVQTLIDPVERTVELRNRIVDKYHLDYIPHIHIDAVVGWPIFFFKGYDFQRNILKYGNEALTVIRALLSRFDGVENIDSIGIDFHKTGFCPFPSSLILFKNKKDIYTLNGVEGKERFVFGEYNMADYILESSRSLIGPMSALAMLKSLGRNGIRSKFIHITQIGIYLSKKINELNDFEVVNPYTFGICVLFCIKNKELDYTYKNLNSLRLTECYRYARYNYEFFVYCTRYLKEFGAMIGYTSGYNFGKQEKVFMGILKFQSFCLSLDYDLVDELVCKLSKMKQKYDCIIKQGKGNFSDSTVKFKFSYDI